MPSVNVKCWYLKLQKLNKLKSMPISKILHKSAEKLKIAEKTAIGQFWMILVQNGWSPTKCILRFNILPGRVRPTDHIKMSGELMMVKTDQIFVIKIYAHVKSSPHCHFPYLCHFKFLLQPFD